MEVVHAGPTNGKTAEDAGHRVGKYLLGTSNDKHRCCSHTYRCQLDVGAQSSSEEGVLLVIGPRLDEVAESGHVPSEGNPLYCILIDKGTSRDDFQ